MGIRRRHILLSNFFGLLYAIGLWDLTYPHFDHVNCQIVIIQRVRGDLFNCIFASVRTNLEYVLIIISLKLIRNLPKEGSFRKIP